ncbi:hypothetical protein NB595_02325 [Vibrio alginolyticus]|uniref:hypothetical protein n=1 Tax=Vibrio TaxID=662 RepID=UPI00215C4EC3|nr:MULTISPECIES: hypothetical protein [Vibrio]MCR9897088.1 hypothetical protein [Vibrio alginolyticus]MDW2071155.1 hypothetical protein [Vibrio sp. 2096]MDW3142363.1 hypothetical protein [Vibrio sp. 2094]
MKSKETWIVVTAAVFILIVFVVYRVNFSGDFSPSHIRWAEFGSFFGGVLGPILVFFSLLFLSRQLELQRLEIKRSSEESELRYREDYISRNLNLLQIQLGEPVNEKTFSHLILSIYRSSDVRKYNEVFKKGMSSRAEALITWVNISIALSRVKFVNHERYNELLVLIIVTIGNELCSALDEVVTSATDISINQHFKNK